MNSWISKAFDSTSNLYSSDVRSQLPRWRTPSPMAASIIPAPIVQSTYSLPTRQLAQSIVEEAPTANDDRQRELEADLQYLLDAQAEALVKGAAGGVPSSQVSTGSTTPTLRSYRSQSSRRSRAPVRKIPGIKSTRKSIYNCIVALSNVKSGELADFDTELEENQRTLEQIDEWEDREKGLREVSGEFDESEEAVRSQRLRQEADALQVEINEVEVRLAEMKSRQMKILRQAESLENSVQAKAASYESSLSMLEADVNRFLSRRPQQHKLRSMDRHEASMWKLPPKRRTLEMAREYWQAQNQVVESQRKTVEHDKSALDEGAAVWKDTVVEVTNFEKGMRTEISSMSPSNSTSAWDDTPAKTPSESLQGLMTHLDEVITSLDTKFKLAEERNWRLLIAAIGAELDALRQGKRVLEDMQERKSDGKDTEPANSSAREEEHREYEEHEETTGSDMRDLQDGIDSQQTQADAHSLPDTDEDPDPELLFSRQDTDGE